MTFMAPNTKEYLQVKLADRGVRITRQRRAILSVIEGADRHLDASQILRWARRSEPSVDRVTVYRTLTLLKRHGLIDELDLMHVTGDAHFYEQRPKQDHIHITCLHCGSVIELESEYLQKMKLQAEKVSGFPIELTRIEMGGTCGKCRNNRGTKMLKPSAQR